MLKGERVIRDVATTEGVRTIRVKVYYDLGGPNYFSGGTKERGYWLSVTPEERTKGMVVQTAFSGVCELLEPASRYSAKRLSEINPGEDRIKKLLDYVLAKNKLAIKEAH